MKSLIIFENDSILNSLRISVNLGFTIRSQMLDHNFDILLSPFISNPYGNGKEWFIRDGWLIVE